MCFAERVQLIHLICMMCNEPGMAVPGKDEQLFTDWSVTCWCIGGDAGCFST